MIGKDVTGHSDTLRKYGGATPTPQRKNNGCKSRSKRNNNPQYSTIIIIHIRFLSKGVLQATPKYPKRNSSNSSQAHEAKAAFGVCVCVFDEGVMEVMWNSINDGCLAESTKSRAI